MRAPIRPVTGIVIVSVISFFVLIYFVAILFFGSLVREGVNRIGPTVLQAPVQLEEATLAPFSGWGTLTDLRIGNPAGWSSQIFSIPMVSGQRWALTSGDLLLVVGLVCLFFEVLKSTNTGRTSVIEHMLSTALFVVFLIEFLLAGAAASSVFFLLMVMSIVVR